MDSKSCAAELGSYICMKLMATVMAGEKGELRKQNEARTGMHGTILFKLVRKSLRLPALRCMPTSAPVVTAVDRKSSCGDLTCILRKLENGCFKLASLKLLWNAAEVVQDEEVGW